MTYYNSKKFRIFNDNGILEKGLLFKSFTIIFPSIMAIYVSFTRVSDNRHFVLDVVAGAAIGTFVGVYYMKLIVSEITNAWYLNDLSLKYIFKMSISYCKTLQLMNLFSAY